MNDINLQISGGGVCKYGMQYVVKTRWQRCKYSILGISPRRDGNDNDNRNDKKKKMKKDDDDDSGGSCSIGNLKNKKRFRG